MTLQPATLATQDDFDVILKVYAGPAYKDLDLTLYSEGAIIVPGAGWTEVTQDVVYSGGLTLERTSSTVRFSAKLSGINYDASYFGPGQAILCLYRNEVAGVQVDPVPAEIEDNEGHITLVDSWAVFFLGHITEGGHEDDYKHGGRWTRQMGGLDTLLQRSTAPRLAAGRVDLLSNAEVTASSTLLVPASEAGTGEFAGSLVTVEPENTIDNNINTLWMSNGMPHLGTLTQPYGDVRRLFLKPLDGYDQSKLWWIELDDSEFNLRNQDGVFVFLERPTGSKVILCANRPYFEAYFGADFDVDEIIDVRTLRQGHFSVGQSCNPGPDDDPPGDGNCWSTIILNDAEPFTLNPTAGWIQINDGYNNDPRSAVAWNQDGSNVDIDGGSWGPGVAWDAGPSPAINISTMPINWGLFHQAAGNVATNFTFDKYMVPGENFSKPNTMEWLFYSLERQNAALALDVAAGATSITMSSTVGFLDAGTAICEGDTFTYTDRTATGLTGIPATGANALGSHLIGAEVNQVIGGITQFGWPCSQLELLRPQTPGLTGIVAGRVFFVTTSLTTPTMPGTNEPEDPADPANDWQEDYDTNVILLWSANANGLLDYGRALTGPDGGPRWVQHVLVVFDQMTNVGRARLNECNLYLAQTQINNSGLGDIDTLSSAVLAEYLLGLAGASINFTYGVIVAQNHLIGEHATAIMPYPRVLDDLARITGCIMNWGRAGAASWNHDMWWPVGIENTQLTPLALLDATCLQGTVQYSGRKPDEVGVRIHARTPDGLRQYTATFPNTVSATDQLIELDDLVVVSQNVVSALAQTMYYKNGLNYLLGAQEIIFSTKGAGLWLRPEMYVQIPNVADTGAVIDQSVYDQVPGQTHTTTSWLIESVDWEWGLGENNVRTWKNTARGRRFWR
jgi:hypothetical protein